jgi:hypothetical protein
MKSLDITKGRIAVYRRQLGLMLLAALAVTGVATANADAAPPAGLQTDKAVSAFAIRWFAEMQQGRIDRTQYAGTYGAQLTDDAVQVLSKEIDRYGASPLRAEIMEKRAMNDQTFYKIKLVFPRGDVTSLLLWHAGSTFTNNITIVLSDLLKTHRRMTGRTANCCAVVLLTRLPLAK